MMRVEIIKKVAVGLLVASLIGSQSFAAMDRKAGLDVGGEVYYYNYEEPNFAELEGVYYGVNTSYRWDSPTTPWVALGEVRTAWGVVDYSSNGTGTASDIDDFVVEPRAWVGYDIDANGTLFTPYFGIGYRYLENSLGGTVTSTGHLGYDRTSQYLYSPVGLEVSGRINDEWGVAFTVEYDIFWDGQQESELSDVVAGLSDVENDQNDGYGVRASVRITKHTPQFDLVIEPFVRYWDVDDSDVTAVTYQGVAVGYGLEPANKTYEVGAKVAFVF